MVAAYTISWAGSCFFFPVALGGKGVGFSLKWGIHGLRCKDNVHQFFKKKGWASEVYAICKGMINPLGLHDTREVTRAHERMISWTMGVTSMRLESANRRVDFLPFPLMGLSLFIFGTVECFQILHVHDAHPPLPGNLTSLLGCLCLILLDDLVCVNSCSIKNLRRRPCINK